MQNARLISTHTPCHQCAHLLSRKESVSSILSANRLARSVGIGDRHFPLWEFGGFLPALLLYDTAKYIVVVSISFVHFGWFAGYEIRRMRYLFDKISARACHVVFTAVV